MVAGCWGASRQAAGAGTIRIPNGRNGKAIIDCAPYKLGVKIRCPKCKSDAILEDGFGRIRCDCGLDITYGEYVRLVAHNDPAYSDILGDYASNTGGEKAGTLDDWE